MRFNPQTELAKPLRRNKLSGAIDIAIADAERFGTDLVTGDGRGGVQFISPKALKRRLAKQK